MQLRAFTAVRGRGGPVHTPARTTHARTHTHIDAT